MSQRGYKRKYKPRKEMSLAELKRMVALGHQRMREKHGLSNEKRNWNAAPQRTQKQKTDLESRNRRIARGEDPFRNFNPDA